MENIIKKISNTLSLILVFTFSALFYFNYKGFVIDAEGNIVLKKQVAEAAEPLKMNGIAAILPYDININPSTKFALGSSTAPLTMYEYSSLGCPHCADFHLEIVPKLVDEYVAKGLLRIVFVNFPLDKQSMRAAMVLQCATPDQYHDFLGLLFNKQRFWFLSNDDTQLFDYAKKYGIDYEEFQKCISDDNMAKDIIADRQQGIKQLRMQGTPAFLFKGADGNEIVYGVPNYDDLREYLNNRLKYML